MRFAFTKRRGYSASGQNSVLAHAGSDMESRPATLAAGSVTDAYHTISHPSILGFQQFYTIDLQGDCLSPCLCLQMIYLAMLPGKISAAQLSSLASLPPGNADSILTSKSHFIILSAALSTQENSSRRTCYGHQIRLNSHVASIIITGKHLTIRIRNKAQRSVHRRCLSAIDRKRRHLDRSRCNLAALHPAGNRLSRIDTG